MGPLVPGCLGPASHAPRSGSLYTQIVSRSLIAALLLFLAPSARSEGSQAMPISDVVQEAIKASAQANNQSSSPISVKGYGDGLQRSLERTRTHSYGGYRWAVEPDARDAVKSEDVGELINASARYIGPDRINVPGPTTQQALERLREMHKQGRVYTANLDGDTLATFNSTQQDRYGWIKASKTAMRICRILKPRPCAAFLYHEIFHHFDEDLHHGHGQEDMAQVIKEESFAFIGMQKYLRGAYKNDRQAHEMFATSLMELEALYRETHDPLVLKAQGYLRTINAVYGAVDETGKPDDKKLAELIKATYKADGSPKAPSA